MKKQIKLFLTAFLAIFIALPMLHAGAADSKPADGEKAITLAVLKDKSDEVSATGQYIDSAAKWIVEDGKSYVVATLKSSKWWESFKVQAAQPGSFEDKNFVDVEVLSTDEAANTRTVKFAVPDINQVLNAKIHIIVTGVPGVGSYDNSYDIRLKFTSEEKGEETGKEDGENGKEDDENGNGETPAKPALKDGEYTISFEALHEKEDKASSMARYIAAPASLTVKNGKNTVAFTLTNNEQIKQFQVEKDGELADSIVVSVDETANTRVVSFEVDDLSAIVNAKVQGFVAAQNYTGNHLIRLAFDPSSAKLVKAPIEVKFEDIESSWAKEFIVSLASQGKIKGLSEERFSPDTAITRAQFTVMLARVLDLPTASYEGAFADVTKKLDWAVLEIEAAHRAGIVQGSNSGFKPGDKISREQMVTMIVKAIEKVNADLLKDVQGSLEFADSATIQDYAKNNVELAVGLGIIDGKVVNGKTVFAPKDIATRAQAAKMIYQLLETIK